MKKAYNYFKTLVGIQDWKKQLSELPSCHDTPHLHTLEDEEVWEMRFPYKDTNNIRNVLMNGYPSVKIFSDIDFKYKYIRARNALDTLKPYFFEALGLEGRVNSWSHWHNDQIDGFMYSNGYDNQFSRTSNRAVDFDGKIHILDVRKIYLTISTSC